MKSVMSHSFSRVPGPTINRSSFDRSCGYKTTFDAGYLVPVFVDEALPGDTFNLRMTSFARLATPIAPLMDNLKLTTMFFAVPYRLVWDNFPYFMGEKENPDDTTSFILPITESPSGGYLEHTLQDYMGLPTKIEGLEHCSLPLRCYNLIYNEWIRDENLIDRVPVPKGDGPDDWDDFVLLKRGKRHDYLTACLPWPQKGDAVSLPLGDYAAIKGQRYDGTVTNDVFLKASDDSTALRIGTNAAGEVISDPTKASAPLLRWQQPGDHTGDPTDGFNYADLSTATAATINSLRQAIQLQRMYERDARGGTRYTEVIRSHFGVISPDARLQRPELLSINTQPINIHPVPKTSTTDGTSPQGSLAGFGTSSGGSGFTKSFTEHTFIIGMVCVHADLTYQQGLNRMWSRSTRFDLYWPTLSSLGEQAVLNKEIYAQGTSDDDLVFGYQERYAEYRYKPSQITGLFRSNATGSLDFWHLSQEFEALPLLNDTFITEDPPVDRVIAVPSQPHMLFDAYVNLRCARPMPIYSVPGGHLGL